MSEAERIIDRYFQNGTTAIVYYDLDQDVFNNVIKNVGKYEKPDILSAFNNKIVGIEHFEFDSYKRSRKGSDFQIQHNNIEQNVQKIIDEKLRTKDKVTVHSHLNSTSSLNNYFQNFKHNFLSHYEKIDSYIEHIQNDFGNDKNISICFFAEDVTPLGNYFIDRENDDKTYLLNPLYSDEIIDLLIKSPKVKYLIIGMYAMNEYTLTIIENKKEALEKFKKERINFKEEDYLSFSPQITSFATLIPKEEIKN